MELIKLRKIQSAGELMVQLGKPATTYPNIVSGRQSVTIEMLSKLMELYGASSEYLFSGKGGYFERVKSEWSGEARPSVITVEQESGKASVLVVEEPVLASYAEGFNDPLFISDLPTECLPKDLERKGVIRKFMVYGDSMEPTFAHGDFVYCSFVDTYSNKDLSTIIRNDHVYIINSVRGLYIKRIHYQGGSEVIQLHSDKYLIGGGEAYKPFELRLREVRELWYFRRRYTAQAEKPNQELLSLRKQLEATQRGLEELKEKLKG